MIIFLVFPDIVFYEIELSDARISDMISDMSIS